VARHSPGALAIWAKAGVSELFHKLIAAAKRRLGLSNLTLTSASQMQKNAQPAKLANPRTDTDHEDDFSA
jgi:hypothetical protein